MYKIGLIGAGHIGAVHARNIACHPALTLAASYSRSSQRRQAFAVEFGGRAAHSLEDILDAPDIDAVMIASSTDSHSELLQRAAHSGKPVFCEKPIDLSLDEARKAAAVVRDCGARVMMGFNRRYEESHAAVRAQVASGGLGRLQIVQLTSRGPSRLASVEYLRTSGGFFRDKGVHFFDLARFITGDEVEEVSAMGAALVHQDVRDLGDFDTAIVSLRMRGGALCQIDNSRTASYGYDERIEAFGSQGWVESCRQPAAAVRRAVGAELASAPFPQTIYERIGGSYYRVIEGFADFIAGHEASVPTIEDGLAAQCIAEAAVLSAREGRSVRIDELDPS
ncbi:Gfo/Idh/MocA family oxidoreductase [Castellaniella sp. S9]|uniref:Gfo/Idh/MocA family oxidoreductase n=1 Tax=Castellaniella sp. S9 TaxID=2993652 RepID=UPI0022B544C1|nr:Gfo/Idh/MocA family oxidoreductase [Castellaniella sp. S9]